MNSVAPPHGFLCKIAKDFICFVHPCFIGSEYLSNHIILPSLFISVIALTLDFLIYMFMHMYQPLHLCSLSMCTSSSVCIFRLPYVDAWLQWHNVKNNVHKMSSVCSWFILPLLCTCIGNSGKREQASPRYSSLFSLICKLCLHCLPSHHLIFIHEIWMFDIQQ